MCSRLDLDTGGWSRYGASHEDGVGWSKPHEGGVGMDLGTGRWSMYGANQEDME